MRKRVLAIILATVLCFAFSGCGNTAQTDGAADGSKTDSEETTKQSGEEITIGFSNFSFTIEYQAKLKDKLEAAVQAKWGDSAKVVSTDAELDTSKQIADVENLISQGVDAIVLVPLDAEQLIPAIQACVDAGIPCFEVCLQCNDDIRTSFVGSNDVTSGEMAMEYMAEKLDYKGNIVLLDGIAGMDSNIKRMDGARAVIEKYPEMNIVTEKLCNGSRDEAMQAMENIIQSGKAVDGVFTICDEEALGALAAIEGTDLEGEILITGIDGDADVLEGIKNGSILCTSFQDAGLQATTVVDAIDNYLNGKDIEKAYDVPYQLVTEENIDDSYWTE
ncbi:MAG: substrate-binding domain-containing protein [Hespellia sp.]|nr:substrate-binding domain-containing protein [Hespellia sp.]